MAKRDADAADQEDTAAQVSEAPYESVHEGDHTHEDGSHFFGVGIPLRFMADARPQCTNQIELMYALYSLFRDNFRGMEINEKYSSTEMLVPLETGNTAIITVAIKTPEDMVKYKERGY